MVHTHTFFFSGAETFDEKKDPCAKKRGGQRAHCISVELCIMHSMF
jgi:hypothetical protein